MTFRHAPLSIPARLKLSICAVVFLFGAQIAVAQIRTVLVSPTPGNSVASGTTLRNALAAIPSPTSTDRWLVKIEPGIYDIGSTSLQMRSWVDMEGSGIGVTTIHGSVDMPYLGTINGADNAELRLLTVEAASANAIAMSNTSVSPRLYRVKFTASGLGAWGIRNFGAAPLIEECEIIATSSGGTGSATYGVVFRDYAYSGARSSILRSKISASFGATNYGVYMQDGQTVTLIRDSQVTVNGGATTYGIYAIQVGTWTGQENLQIRDSEISSFGGSSTSYGMKLETGTSVAFDINGSKVWGHIAPTTYGLMQLGTAPIGLQGASVVGFTKTIQTAGSISIASTFLNGGPVTASGWVGCMGVWDENGIFYANSCPP